MCLLCILGANISDGHNTGGVETKKQIKTLKQIVTELLMPREWTLGREICGDCSNLFKVA